MANTRQNRIFSNHLIFVKPIETGNLIEPVMLSA